MTTAGSIGAPRGEVPARVRVRRRGAWWVRAHVVIFVLALTYIVLSSLLVAVFGAHTLHDKLGERFYNSWIAGNGFPFIVPLFAAMLVADGLIAVGLVLHRISRTRIGAVVASLVVICAAWGLTSWIVRWRAAPDPFRDQLFSLLALMDTEYAPGYSVEAFNSVVPGMPKSEVLERLGPPLPNSRMRSNETFAAYAWSPTDGNYWLREIIYGPDERVQRVVVGLWID